MFRKSIALFLTLLLLLLLAACSAGKSAAVSSVSETAAELEVYFFSAGKADAILLTTENGTVLIDCGEKGYGKTVLDYLDEKEIDHIDYLIITHFDQDHVGGAAKVINNISVGTVLQSNCPKDSEEYEKYCKALDNAGLEPVTVRETLTFSLDGVTFLVDPPAKTDYEDDDSNNSSLITTVYNGRQVFLFMGDAQTERLAEYLSSSPVDCDLLKVPHHGGEDKLMDELVDAVKPEYAVITCSDEEPDITDTVDILDDADVQVYITYVAPVLILSDGSSLTVEYTPES